MFIRIIAMTSDILVAFVYAKGAFIFVIVTFTVWERIKQFVCLSVCMYVCMSAHLSKSLHTCPSSHLSYTLICLSDCLSVLHFCPPFSRLPASQSV